MPRSSRRRGISLVEVLMALTVLSVMLLPLTLMIQFGARSGHSGQKQLVATLFNHEVLEVIRAEVEQWTDESSEIFRMPRVELRAPSGYEYRLEVRPVGEGLDEVTVITSWKHRRGRTRSARLSVLISRKGTLLPSLPGRRWRESGA